MESTPDPPSIVWQGYRPATWAQRLAAQILDGLFVGGGALTAILGLLIVFGSRLNAHRAGELDDPWAQVVLGVMHEDMGWALFILGVAALLVYAVWCLSTFADGRTPGKQIAGIRVVRTTGEPSSWGGTLVREVVLKWMVGTCFGLVTVGIYCVVDYLWPLWDRNRQALHDKMAETLVVQARPVARRPPPRLSRSPGNRSRPKSRSRPRKPRTHPSSRGVPAMVMQQVVQFRRLAEGDSSAAGPG